MSLEDKLKELKESIREKGKLLVAYSGGVDSSLLAKVAHDVLGEEALAVILASETYAKTELDGAVELAESLGLNFMVARFSILADEEFIQNPPMRCYICKRRSIEKLLRIAHEQGIECIADGVNLNDYEDFRPGIQACDEMDIWHPFVQAKISKEDIRALAREIGLPVWNKPSSACLSSRIPYGEMITKESLMMVGEAENYLKSLGLGQLRVRMQGKTARIELLNSELERAIKRRESIVMKLKSIGFKYVTLDLEGFRSGSMNEVL